MSGLNPLIYWTTAFIWDAICFLLPVVSFIAIFAAFDIRVIFSFQRYYRIATFLIAIEILKTFYKKT